MGISKEHRDFIEFVLKKSLRRKFQNYNPEPASMPFHISLLGRDRMALFSFIHSLNTTFGTSIFEPVALALAKKNFKETESHFDVGNYISEGAQVMIQSIMDKLTTAEAAPNKRKEIEAIRKVCQNGSMRKVKLTKVDVFLKMKKERCIYLI